MTIHHTPWHALAVAEVFYCAQNDAPDTLKLACRDEDGWCTGHAESAPGRVSEIEHDLTHPADCESRTEYLDCLTADLVCADDAVLPVEPGAYQVRARTHLPQGSSGDAGATLEFTAAQSGGAS